MRNILAMGAVAFLLSGAARSDVLYSIDDGSADLVRGGIDGFDGFIGNLFFAQDGGRTITAIDVAWGSPIDTGHAPAGTPIEVHLYDDPNNDGVLDDLVLLASNVGTIAAPDTDTFVRYPIAPTVVTGNFLAATIIRDLAAGPSPISTDQSAFQGATFTLLAPNIDASDIEPNFSFPAIDGNAMGRAIGVPEPSAAVLMVLSLAVLGCFVRRVK